MRKRIGVLAAQIDEATQKRFLNEFIRQVYAYNYDVCVFTMYQKYQETPLRDIGDSNIFKLVNFELFDAVLILADTILTPGLYGPLEEHVRVNFDGPVLVVDKESAIFESVMMDHYTPVRNIVDHLIEVHNFSKIAFLGGKEGHPHSVQRLNGFLDSMKAHNLSVEDKWIYHGNYWYDSAEQFVDMLLEDRDNLPEAIACANDCMAIGAAARLTEAGIKIPEDIAITGYDSLEDGRYAPAPLTSANIPADQCGQYCARWINARLSGDTLDEFTTRAPIFVGSSCGCKHEVEMVPKKLRSHWRTSQSSRGLYSDFNHLLEDMMDQTNLRGFLKTVNEYCYQIRPFTSFNICLNDGFINPDVFVGENAITDGYSETMYEVLSCDSLRGSIDLHRSFETEEISPLLEEERDYPTTFIFNPLYSDDRCFGYTVLNYGEEPKVYDENYRIWMRNIMQGMEAFYRQYYMHTLIDRIKADQVRDALTGLYNYEGFIKNADRLAESAALDDRWLNIIAIDIKGITQINEIYGRDFGERAIKAVARILQNALREDEICCRMCNDEFVVAVKDDEDSIRAHSFMETIIDRIHNYKLVSNSEFELGVYCENLIGLPEKPGELENLINQTINIKNHKKTVSFNMNVENSEVMDEIKRNQLVNHILNQNLLTYYFQPIVNVYDGSIFAYEALMRYTGAHITPLQIIQSATYLNRLADIEKSTLLKVTKIVEDNIGAFGASRVFINSYPGVELSPEDDKEFVTRLLHNKGRYVIEFTEESELDDEQLEKFKEKYEILESQIAIDDYGAGYSNVNNLLRYMPKYVKIDRMLVTDIQDNQQKQHFVRNIIEFAHNNNIIALAEGVETREELRVCIRLGVDLVQGYYTGKAAPVPAGQIPDEIVDDILQFKQQNIGWN